MIPAVFDCNVVLAAIGWSGTARLCLKLSAEHRVRMFVTEYILTEYETVIPERLGTRLAGLDPWPKLEWIRSKAQVVEPVPLGKQRSRDQKDDPYLACALAAHAVIVTFDNDLLQLGKPFGVEIIRPAELLRRMG